MLVSITLGRWLPLVLFVASLLFTLSSTLLPGIPLGSGRQLPPQLTVGRRPLGGGGGGGGGGFEGGV